jgi:ABC-type glycerol-3-phosphate transport system permease component
MVLQTFVIFYLIAIIFPLAWIFSLTLRLPNEAFESYLFLIPKHITFDNYAKAFRIFHEQGFGFSLEGLFFNSIIITLSSVLLTLLISMLAGYALAKLPSSYKKLNSILLLSSLAIPSQTILIPLLIQARFMGILNTRIGLILIYTAFNGGLAAIIVTGFLKTLPDDILNAARLDGCSELQVFTRVVLPLSRPALFSTFILLLLLNWNEFTFALVFLRNPKFMTLPVGISNLIGPYYIEWPVYAACLVLSAIPITIAYIIFQKEFAKGIIIGGIKR